MQIRCVIAAVDGSPESLRAVDWAADEASRRGVCLRLVHACVWERYEQDTPDEDSPSPVREAVQELLAGAVERAIGRCPDLEVVTEVLPQETVPALLGLSHLSPLLVLGTRGHRGLAGRLLGSVSLRVAGRAMYPLVIVHDVRQAVDRRHRRIVLGAAPGEPVEDSVAFAVQEARLWAAELQLVQVRQSAPTPGEFALLKGADVSAERARSLLAASAAPDLSTVVAEADCPVTPDQAAEALLWAGGEADLIVLGARRRRSQLGPVTHAVLHHARCPVALLPLR